MNSDSDRAANQVIRNTLLSVWMFRTHSDRRSGYGMKVGTDISASADKISSIFTNYALCKFIATIFYRAGGCCNRRHDVGWIERTVGAERSIQIMLVVDNIHDRHERSPPSLLYGANCDDRYYKSVEDEGETHHVYSPFPYDTIPTDIRYGRKRILVFIVV